MQIMRGKQHIETYRFILTWTTEQLDHTVEFTGEELMGLIIIRSSSKTEPWEIAISYVYNWTVKMELDKLAKEAFH